MISKLRKDWLVLILILSLTLLLRLFSLGTSLPVFVDEAIYIRWAQVMRVEETLRFLPLSDGKQPLFMWVMIPFLKFVSDPLVAGRLVSVLSGLAVVIGVGFVSWLLFYSRRITLMTMFLAAVSPFLIFFDRKALVDSFLSAWGVGTLLLGLLFVKKPRFDLALLIGVTLGGGWLTKSPGEIFFFLLPTTLLVTQKKDLTKRKYWLKAVGGFCLALLIGFGIYNILRLGPNFHLIGARNLDYVYTLGEIAKHPLTPLVGNLSQVLQWLVILLPLPLLVLSVVGLCLMLLGMPLVAFLIAFWGISPILFQSLIGKVFTARYILFAVPALLIYAGYGLSRITPKSLTLKVLLALFIILPILWQDYLLVVNPAKAWLPENERNGYLEEWTAGYGLREIATYLKSRPRDTHILVGTEGFFGTTPDGLEMFLEGYPNIRVTGLAYPIKGVPDSLRSAVKDNEVYLVVNRSRFEIDDPGSKSLFLISSFGRPARSNGSSDSLLFFRLNLPNS